MVERAPFLNAAYSAYHHRGLPAEDLEMTRIGPDTPCGEYLRRFWQPGILASELGDLPRQKRPPRPAGAVLPPSRHLSRVRPDRRQGYPLLLSRLAYRC